MPKAQFNGLDLHPTIFDKTAAYLFHIVKKHRFLDGNKRTEAIVAMIFFSNNFDGGFGFMDNNYQELILDVIKGNVGKIEIANFFHTHSWKYEEGLQK